MTEDYTLRFDASAYIKGAVDNIMNDLDEDELRQFANGELAVEHIIAFGSGFQAVDAAREDMVTELDEYLDRWLETELRQALDAEIDALGLNDDGDEEAE